MIIEYVPFFVLLIIEIVIHRKKWPVVYAPPKKISIVIPVLNETTTIAGCIESILVQNVPYEIIVVDGGSTDDTLEKVRIYKSIIICQTTAGRGVQIARGVEQARGDVIVALHADSRLAANSLQKVFHALTEHLDAAGGAMETLYFSTNSRLKLTGVMNNLRLRFLGISFGDQAQFFRKPALPEGFPDYRLMEDIEVSMILKERGTLLIIPKGALSSSRRWAKTGYLRNFLKVIWITGLFVFLRSLSLVKDKGDWFYRTYYYGKA